jgi:hypothetical protein
MASKEETDALERVLGAGQARHPAQGTLLLDGHWQLDRVLAAILCGSLAMPGSTCAPITQDSVSLGSSRFWIWPDRFLLA